MKSAAIAVACLALAATAAAQVSTGAQVFRSQCASCHTGQPDSRAPSPDALTSRTPQAVIEALTTGAMRVQGSKLSGGDRRAVAEYLTGKQVGDDVLGAAKGRCTTASAAGATRGARWSGWSPSPTNSRLQTTEQAGLAAADVPRLTLKWAFGFPDAASAWAQPTVALGRVFVGSQNGTVYSLDASSGCIRWTFSASGGVRTAITIATIGARTAAFFGDTGANAYAIDADTGMKIWSRKVEDHPLARITGSPTFYDGRLYVPVSSYEEAQGADPAYGCCTFRGSVSALDAATGAVIWKTYTVADTPKPRGRSSAGVDLFGPSGSAIWSAPTIDAKRGALYVATGNTYSGPPQPSSDAIVAIDLTSGAIRWMKQATPSDIYITGCGRSANPNCPETNGPDVDFGSPPILATTAAGRDLIVIGQKSGVGWAFDPDRQGAVVWQYRAGEGSALGGIEWGSAADGARAYFAVSDILRPKPGGLHAVSLDSGERAWVAAPAPPKCGGGRGCNGAQSAALTLLPGVIFSGSNDGALRAYSVLDGSVIWEYDSNRDF
ncbi:MAG TPA: PQQ-binding-like beta-propeller repeat protein, partial [Vicinamibacterales bacterium]|nr:PQQ-binding-like beta-propeller repeat protein [Vicinamibacterales bacterium]